MKKIYLERSIWLPEPMERLFAFFRDPLNLERITPEWLRFKILTPLPIEVQLSTRIQYSLRLYGIPLRWESEITVWEPPLCFCDVQIAGPYRLWEHSHTFEEIEGGTRMTDSVVYGPPGGFAAGLVDHLFVRNHLTRIFDYRETVIRSIFGVPEGQGDDVSLWTVR